MQACTDRGMNTLSAPTVVARLSRSQATHRSIRRADREPADAHHDLAMLIGRCALRNQKAFLAAIPNGETLIRVGEPTRERLRRAKALLITREDVAAEKTLPSPHVLYEGAYIHL